MRAGSLYLASSVTDPVNSLSWYGPPPSAASTSKLPAQPVVQTASSSTFAPDHGHTLFRQASVTPSESPAPGTKKRKRLTGSQKKARKAAKLAATNTAPVGDEDEPAAANDSHETHDSPHAVAPAPAAPAAPSSPSYAPSSPKYAPDRPLPSPPAASTSAATSGAPIGPQHPSSFAFVVPPVSSLPTTFPPPPPIAPLTGDEPSLEPETPEALLEAALWSWYSEFLPSSASACVQTAARRRFSLWIETHQNRASAAAGYQTALYHAAVGVAKFKPSPGDE